MNREIKFRAWIIDENKMSYMNEWFSFMDSHIQYADQGYYVNNLSASQEHKDHLQDKGIECRDEFILMQFTGLKENAYEQTEFNKEIYEGDIIEFIDGERLSVEWNDDTCQFQYSDGSPINDRDRYATHKAIIGNIYQNPELLESVKK